MNVKILNSAKSFGQFKSNLNSIIFTNIKAFIPLNQNSLKCQSIFCIRNTNFTAGKNITPNRNFSTLYFEILLAEVVADAAKECRKESPSSKMSS